MLSIFMAALCTTTGLIIGVVLAVAAQAQYNNEHRDEWPPRKGR